MTSSRRGLSFPRLRSRPSGAGRLTPREETARTRWRRLKLLSNRPMPALVATRFNEDLKQIYQRNIANGKSVKFAITAIMRKLVILANALIREDRKWAPNMA